MLPPAHTNGDVDSGDSDPAALQGQAGSPLGPAPAVATPDSAIDFPARVTTTDDGVAVLRVGVTDPGNPRDYIDGQVYGVRPVLEETIFSPDAPYPFNPSDFISVLVWDDFHPPEDPVTWWGSLQSVLQQFENLYPVMKRFVRLGDYDSVCENRDMLLLAFGLDAENPNHMPVTRDLSMAKRSREARPSTVVHHGAMSPCRHLDQVRAVLPSSPGCEDCLTAGRRDWVHLRLCQTCGHVGCCDSSPGRHATEHFHSTAHPIIRSFEPGEDWFWCYVDEAVFEVAGAPPAASHPGNK